MSGITVIETGVNVASFSNAWVDFATAVQGYAHGEATPENVETATAALASAATALSKAPGFSTISGVAGFISGKMGLEADQRALADAVDNHNSMAQAAAVAGLIADGAAIAGGVATTVAVLSPKTAPAMGLIATASGTVSLVAATVQKAIGGVNWLQDYLNALNQAIIDAAFKESAELQIMLNDMHGNAEIFVPGNGNDSFTGSLAGGSLFEVTESGTETGRVVLDMSGSKINVKITGSDIVSNVDNFQIDLEDGASAAINGKGNTINLGTGATVTFNFADDNLILDGATGNEIRIANGAVTASGEHGVVSGGVTGSVTSFDDGSQDVYAYNAAGVKTDRLLVQGGGTSVHEFYDEHGILAEVDMNFADGSRYVLKSNSAGQVVEQTNYASDGSGRQFIVDPVSRGVIAINDIHADGSVDNVYRILASVRMNASDRAGVETEINQGAAVITDFPAEIGIPDSNASASGEVDRRAAQLIQAMAAYAPESSAQTSLTTAPVNPEIQFAPSVH
ncbi:hypothetical protein ACAX43_01480 [Paraburkholderia sp. IW21]|uniref:hypothetical protein n=1 Tax=Paraburkholderia sp. IW21 TaxID=3242488 RepID=UPI0035221175